MKKPYLVADDYGMGAVWAYILADSPEDILRRYPQLSVVDDPPAGLTSERLRRIRETRTIDIEDEQNEFLRAARRTVPPPTRDKTEMTHSAAGTEDPIDLGLPAGAVSESVQRLVAQYRSLGRVSAGEILLEPEVSLRFVNDLAELGVSIDGVDFWRVLGPHVVEIPWGRPLRGETAAEAAADAKRTIVEDRPEEAQYVSLVFPGYHIADAIGEG